MAKYIRSAFSASYLVAESDGEIRGQEAEAFRQALKQLHDFDMDPDDVWESFRESLELDEEEHLSRVAEAAGLSEELRREILQVALAVASADGEVSLSEILCLPDIAAALGIELGDEDDDDGDSEEDEAVHFPGNTHREKQTSVSDREKVLIGVCTHDFRLDENETDEVVPDPVRFARSEWLGSGNDPGHPRYQTACRLLSEYYNCVFNEAVDTFSIRMKFTLDLEDGSIEQDDSAEEFTSADEDAGVEDALGGAPKLKSLKVVSIDFRESPSFEAVSDNDHLLCFPEVGLVAVFEGHLGRDFGNKASLAAWVEQKQEIVASRFRFEPREAPEDQETDDDGFYSSFSWSGGDATVRISGSSSIDSFFVELTQSVFEKRKEEEGTSEVVSEEFLAGLRKVSAALEAQPEASREDDEDSSDEDDGEASERFAASLREAEAALKAEGNPAPSAAEISQRAISDVLSGMAGNLEAALVQRRGFAAWKAGDYEAAYGFYLEAAEAGDKDAMYNLGQMYMAGEWVEADLDQALGWWQRAAAEGHLMAQRNAWKTFWNRDDLKSALEYARMAAAQGDEESAEFFREQVVPVLRLSGLIAGALTAEADGSVSDEELISFGEAWKRILGIDYTLEDVRAAFTNMAGTDENEQERLERLSDLAGKLPLDLRQLILRNSVLVALSDHDFASEEQELVEKLAAALDVDLSDLGGGLGLRRVEDAGQSDQLSQPVDPEVYDPEINPLLVAALHGDLNKVRALLSAGCSATDVHASGTDAVILAVREGYLEIVELLLQAGADPNRINPQSGMTPLRMAIQKITLEIATLLLKSGANPNLPAAAGDRVILPLELILMFSRNVAEWGADPRGMDIMDAMLKAGADPNAGGPGVSFHLLALALERRRPETLGLLLSAGADPNVKDPEAGLSLFLPVILYASGDADGTAVGMLDLLLEAGMQPAEIGSEVGTVSPVQLAAMQADLPSGFLSRLIERAEKSDLDLALWNACVEGQAQNVRDLLAAGADVNIVVPDLEDDPSAVGDSPLNAACARGYTECVRLLLEAGANPNQNAPPEGGQFPLLMAAENGHEEIVAMLLGAGASAAMINPENQTSPLCGAVRNGHEDITGILLDAGADPNTVSGDSGSPVIVLAAQTGNIDIVSRLIDDGADVDAAGKVSGNTALLRAAAMGHGKTVELLLRRGADANKPNPVTGADALLVAVVERKTHCVRLLLDAGANPNRTYAGEPGDVPILIIASEKGDAEIVRRLLEHGADVNAEAGDGLTALQRAGIHRHKDVEQVLIEFGADPSTRLVKLTDTPAGREMQNEILSRMARNLKETADKIRTLQAGDPPDEPEPETRPRGFFARLFGWGRGP
jgi:ankyrin repeat protein/tellurite resistance protein